MSQNKGFERIADAFDLAISEFNEIYRKPRNLQVTKYDVIRGGESTIESIELLSLIMLIEDIFKTQYSINLDLVEIFEHNPNIQSMWDLEVCLREKFR